MTSTDLASRAPIAPEAAAATTVAEAYLLMLAARRVKRIFVNAGTDFAPLVEAYLRLESAGADLPEIVVCAHENLAVAMAHGAHVGGDGPQVVMLHTNVGTANAVCAMLNAHHSRIPILVVAGRTPLFEQGAVAARDSGIHWTQEMFDQAGMVRESVKWDYELRSGLHLADVIDRALDVATTGPMGPGYLTLPREVLAAPVVDFHPPEPTSTTPTPAHPSGDAIDRLAGHLLAARFPVIVTSSSGAEPAAVALLDEISERFAVGVIEEKPRYVNASPELPGHLGYGMTPAFDHADVMCFLDLPVPWVPSQRSPGADVVVVQTGPDPHFGSIPIRGHRADLSISGANVPVLAALRDALALRADEIDPQRTHRIGAVSASGRGQVPTLADQPLDGPIDKTFLNLALCEVRPEGSVIVNEYWARPELVPSGSPGTYFGAPMTGGLGWGLPAALGVQLVRPEAVVIATVGDGAYIFANPAACHQAMERYRLPVLTIVCSNRIWGAVASSTVAAYPDGLAAASTEINPFADLASTPDFEAYAKASGGWGVRVVRRSELVDTLRAALRIVKGERRHALVNVECE